jgi:hypothetical protein
MNLTENINPNSLIVKPQKRGVERGTVPFEPFMTSQTIADFFLGTLKELLPCFKSPKTSFSV